MFRVPRGGVKRISRAERRNNEIRAVLNDLGSQLQRAVLYAGENATDFSLDITRVLQPMPMAVVQVASEADVAVAVPVLAQL